jgi:hypothetical protein
MKDNGNAEFRGHVAQLTQASASYLSPQAQEKPGRGIGGSSASEN